MARGKKKKKQFKDKFFFYSPYVVYGVDLSIYEEQDVFIYVKGQTLSPSGIFQQATRTRNIKSIYYYCENKCKIPKYATKADAIKEYSLLKDELLIKTMCEQLDENDETTICTNSFFNLFIENQYRNDTVNVNKKYHLENYFIKAGFVIRRIGDIKTIPKEDKKEMMTNLSCCIMTT
jgi:hypothetical protein